jgi:hypothetical protein
MAVTVSTWGRDGHEHVWGPMPEPIDDPMIEDEKEKWQKCTLCEDTRYNPIVETDVETFE